MTEQVTAVKPQLSIVIVTYTEKRLTDLVELLDSIQAQSYSEFEVIVVCEKGQVFELIRKTVERRFPSVKVLESSGIASSGSARNVGILNSVGRLVAFVDDDAILAKDWAGQLVSAFSRNVNVVGVTGYVFPKWERTPPFWVLPEFSWIFGYSAWHGWHSLRDVESVWLMNCGFRREALVRAGGFRPEFGARGDIRSYVTKVGAEDNELSLRVHRITGMRIVFTPNVVVWHKVKAERLRLSFMLSKAFHVGRSRGWLRQHYLSDSRFGLDVRIESMVFIDSLRGTLSSLVKEYNPFRWWEIMAFSFLVLASTVVGYMSIPGAIPSLFLPYSFRHQGKMPLKQSVILSNK